MKGLEFPLYSTKVPGVKKNFDLNSPEDRRRYFKAKAGDEIAHIKNYLKKGSFIAYLLGKKNSGKGTYAKLITEVFGEEKIVHLSVGDLVREVHAGWPKFSKSKDFETLKTLYRGYISFDDAVAAFLGRSTKTLLPTEFILALLKLRIAELKGKSIFVDGLPRETDQISYSLFFRDLAGASEADDLFVLIDIPEAVIDERMKYRVVCPLCQTSRNEKLLITTKVDYDSQKGDFYLVCDNPKCPGARMKKKEGDEFGIAPIKGRLMKDEEILKTVFSLHGIPKILLRNHVPAEEAKNYFDDYEITPQYDFEWDKKAKKVKVIETPWAVKDDNGVESFSLLAPPVAVSLIKQLKEALNL